MSRLKRVSALAWSRIGYTAGSLAAAAGVGIETGVGWGLMVGGVIGAASSLLLIDVGEKRPPEGGDDL